MTTSTAMATVEDLGGGDNSKEWTCGLCGETMKGYYRPYHLEGHG